MIMILEDEPGWREYYKGLLKGRELRFFADGVAAMSEIDDEVPSLLILDVMLVGPTGFAVLNELQSYPELATLPVVVVSGVELSLDDLKKYGVVAVLDKAKMLPVELIELVEHYDGAAHERAED